MLIEGWGELERAHIDSRQRPGRNKASRVRELCPIGSRKEARWLVPAGENGRLSDRMLKYRKT